MTVSAFEDLNRLAASSGVDSAFDQLSKLLTERKDYHKLFDARMLRRKFDLGLPLARPSQLTDVPQEQRKLVEETYVAAAREVGGLFLADGDIPNAWTYLSVIREPKPVSDAIEALPIPQQTDEKTEELMHLALYQGVSPVKGLKMSLKLHGTCSTITALDQSLPNLAPEHRSNCAKVMVRTLYSDLTDNVRRQVEQRIPMVSPDASLRELIGGREWLFEGGNYHIDVSHLNSVVRFARGIESPAEELDLALQLAEYGSKLEGQLQYPGDAPFEDFYPAHIQFFRVLLNKNRADALQYFREKLAHEPDEQDKPILAYVLVDLLVRAGEKGEAVEVASQFLTKVGDESKFSFVDLCREAGRLDVLQKTAEAQNDPVTYLAAVLLAKRPS
jgi:hypothetical protein